MKKMKKVFALLITLIMVLGLGTSAFAAEGDYTITINGAQKGGVYTAYKIFDATLSGSNIAYTVEEGSALETLLRGEDSEAKTAFLAVFDITDNGGPIYVTQKGSAADIVDWMEENAETYKIGNVTTVTNTDGDPSVTLDVGAAGYYYITSTVGTKSAAMLTSTNPKVTINDKVPTEPDTPDNAKKVMIDGQSVDVTTLDLGTVVTFNVTVNPAVNYVVDAEGKSNIVYQYIVEDQPDGFVIDESTVAVTLDQDQAAPTFTKAVDDNGKLTVTIKWADGAGTEADPYVAKYISPSVITVSYDAALTKVTQAKNKAYVYYNEKKDVGDGEDYVYSYIVDITKVDKDNTETKLPGAQFALKNADGKYYKYTAATAATETAPASPAKVEWVDSIDDATTSWTCTEGTQDGTNYQNAKFEGLAAGTYTLVEVTAPKGYNLAADQTVTLEAITTKLEETTTLTVPAEVQDAKGSTLPATGGIGTTIFYVAGTILVIGAGVIMITRRRMSI